MAENMPAPLYLQEDLYDHSLDQALCDAAEAGRNEQVLELLLKGADPNGHGNREEFEFYSGAQIYLTCPLEQAIRGGHLELMRMLLEAGAVPNVGIMHLVCHLNTRRDFISALLECGMAGDVMGALLTVTSGSGDLSAVRLLIDHSPEVVSDRFGGAALHSAAAAGHAEIVAFLLTRGVAVDCRDPHASNTALMIAAEKGRTSVVALLIARGADINAFNYPHQTALFMTVREIRLDAARLLLQAGADPNVKCKSNYTPLNLACIGGDVALVHLLLEFGADPNAGKQGSRYYAPLIDAARSNHTEVVQMLLDCGADPDARSPTGSNGLFCAARNRNRRVVDILIEAGAGLDGIGSALGDDLEMGRLLLDRGADPNATSKAVTYRTDLTGCYTSLMRAAERGDLALVKLLLDRGADINRVGPKGYTALMFTVNPQYSIYESDVGQHLAVAHYLLEHGADVTVHNESGQTALDIADSRYSYNRQRAEPFITLLEAFGTSCTDKHNSE